KSTMIGGVAIDADRYDRERGTTMIRRGRPRSLRLYRGKRRLASKRWKLVRTLPPARKSEYDQGYDAGYNHGFEAQMEHHLQQQENTHAESLSAGVDAGNAAGHDVGRTAGYSGGYDRGSQDGYARTASEHYVKGLYDGGDKWSDQALPYDCIMPDVSVQEV